MHVGPSTELAPTCRAVVEEWVRVLTVGPAAATRALAVVVCVSVAVMVVPVTADRGRLGKPDVTDDGVEVAVNDVRPPVDGADEVVAPERLGCGVGGGAVHVEVDYGTGDIVRVGSRPGQSERTAGDE